ncbi:putative delta-60 repeat protein [Prosthecobacter fusiformis]|uniref:Putative delta-60 repeat protein n=1 Tax=Prosthecobacter fusiformis TaxID=48464 RepID=A0A4R7RI44_9BACT|nr:hypothetical protein [Prosthecobacter fusiformis]TDU62561.1 putative delta-60 repeat protein [Prosthecobacter fusiformis]
MNHKSLFHLTIRIAVFGCLLHSQARAAAGVLDSTFNETGSLTTSLSLSVEGVDEANDVAVQTDGKLVVAGFCLGSGGNFDFAVVRYNEDGSLDATFGIDGKVITNLGSDDRAYCIALQPDGKIVVGGRYGNVNGSGSIGVVRYLTNGSLDTSFSGDGIVNISSGAEDARKLVILSDGEILLAGGTSSMLVQLQSNGTLDTSFSSDGITYAVLDSSPRIRDLKVQSDGKILIAGAAQVLSKNRFMTARLNADGTMDSSFGSQGKITTMIGTTSAEGSALALQSDGKIVVTGTARIGNNDAVATVRYLADGSLDEGFGSGGISTVSVGNGHNSGSDLQLTADGKIMIGGSAFLNGLRHAVMIRLKADGSMDATLGGDGYVMTLVEELEMFVSALVSLDDDRWTLVGYSLTVEGHRDFALVRYLVGPAQIKVIDDVDIVVENNATINMKAVAAGYTSGRTFTVYNIGGDDLQISSSTVVGADFTVDNLSSMLVLPNSSASFEVTFAPVSAESGTRTATLQIGSSAQTASTFEMDLVGKVLSAEEDTDGDGLNDVSEFKFSALGFDPLITQAALVAVLFDNLHEAKPNLNAADFYSTSQVQDLHANAALRRNSTTGEVTLTLEVQKSTSLAAFETLPLSAPAVLFNEAGQIEFRFTPNGDAEFFRVVAP